MSSSSTSISSVVSIVSVVSVTVAGTQVPDLNNFLTVYFFLFSAFFFKIFVRFDYFSLISGFLTQAALALVIPIILTILYFSISSSILSLLSDLISTKVSPATELDSLLTSFLEQLLIFLLYSVLVIYSRICSPCSFLYCNRSIGVSSLKEPRQSLLFLFKYTVPIAI